MDISTQVVQVTAANSVGNTSVKPEVITNGTGKTADAKSFSTALGQIMEKDQSNGLIDETTMSFIALLQGLSNVMLLPAQPLALKNETVGADLQAVLPSSDQPLLPAQAVLPLSDRPILPAQLVDSDQALLPLQELTKQKEVVEQLLGNEKFKKWLLQADELLTAMSSSIQTSNNQNVNVSLVKAPMESNPLMTLAQNPVKAQEIITKFLSVVKAHPESQLFQQLTVDIQELLALSLSVSTDQLQVKRPQTEKVTQDELPATNVLASVNKWKPMQEINNAALLTISEPIINTGIQIVQEKSQMSKLDGLNAKNRIMDRLALALGTFKSDSLAGITEAANSQLLNEESTSFNSSLPTMLLSSTTGSKLLNVLSAKSSTVNQQLMSVLGDISDKEILFDSTSSLSSNQTVPFQDLLKTVTSDQAKLVSVPMSAQSFVQDMSQFVMKNFNINTANGFSEAKFSLSPEHLGQVDVKISMHNGQLVAHFAAQTVLGKEMLESQLSQLRVTLQNQGLNVERLEVSQNSSLQQSSLFQDQRQQQASQQQLAKQNKSQYPNADQAIEDFSQEMANVTSLRSGLYGSAIDISA